MNLKDSILSSTHKKKISMNLDPIKYTSNKFNQKMSISNFYKKKNMMKLIITKISIREMNKPFKNLE